jgi:hypothetical protein
MHECKICTFKTNNKFNYEKHLETSKHKQKANSDKICIHCNKSYSNKYNKNRHEKQCNTNVNNLINSKVGGDAIVGNYNVINKNIYNITIITLGSGENLPLKLTPIVEKLQKNQGKLDKFILECMDKSDSDITTYVDTMDEHLKFGVKNNDEEHLECIKRNKTSCKHERNNFMLSSETVAIALRNALMQLDKDIVMTHEIKNLSGNKSYLFKLRDMLGNKECLRVLFDKSKYKSRINIEREINELEKNPTFVESYDNFRNSTKCRVKKIKKENS